ncbi:hypothetical protein MRX96_043995 [Rhipicephalus microplus]
MVRRCRGGIDCRNRRRPAPNRCLWPADCAPLRRESTREQWPGIARSKSLKAATPKDDGDDTARNSLPDHHFPGPTDVDHA